MAPVVELPIASHLKGWKRNGRGWVALCPCHDDHDPSLRIDIGENGTLLLWCPVCEAPYKQILRDCGFADWGKVRKDEYPGPWEWADLGILEAIYDYTDEAGTLLYQVMKSAQKEFKQRRPDPNRRDGWLYKMKGVRRVLFRLPETMAAVARGDVIYKPEGEKDALNLAALGLAATTAAEGAKAKWLETYTETVSGADVVLLPDNDEEGRAHVQRVAEALWGKVKRLRVLELPNLPHKGDVSDWLNAGGTKEQIEALTAAAPEYRPAVAPEPAERTKPLIQIRKGELPALVGHAARVLSGGEIFTRGGELVRPVRLNAPQHEDGIRRPAFSLMLKPVEGHWLRVALAEAADWEQYDARGKKWLPNDPPMTVAETLIAAPDRGAFPVLQAVAKHPLLLPDGRYMAGRGYDHESGVYLDIEDHWPVLPDRLTKDNAVQARETVEHFLRHYPYSTPEDKAAALAMLVTGIMRPVLDVSPGFALDAPVRGCGKSLFVDALAILMTGVNASVLEYAGDESEMTKRLDSMLLAGDSLIAVDNVEGTLQGAALCQTITQRSRRIRILGTLKRLDVPCTGLLTFTGNNLTLKGDITRRVIVCRLNPQSERPELRAIPQDLLAEAGARRGELVGALQTIVRAFIAAGSPPQGLAPYGSFKLWDRTVRHALVWSGAADPCASFERSHEDNPERQALSMVLKAWHKAFNEDSVMASAACQKAEHLAKEPSPKPYLKEALAEVCWSRGELDARKLAYWLRGNRDSMVDGFVLRREKDRFWQVLNRTTDTTDTTDVFSPERKNVIGEEMTNKGSEYETSVACVASVKGFEFAVDEDKDEDDDLF